MVATRIHQFELPLEHEFTIARGSTSIQQTIVVELEWEGIHGYGEVPENSYYGHSLESISGSIKSVIPFLNDWNPDHSENTCAQELWHELSKRMDDSFALSAIDGAVYDLIGKIKSKHTFDLLGLEWSNLPESSYTIGIGTSEKMEEKLQQRPNWKNYKIKLGTENDVEIVKKLRVSTDATFRVDANCGWGVEETIENSWKLKELGVQFIEQPLPADANSKDKQRVFEESALPIVADENCLIEEDIEKCFGLFHGVNVKLCKCGGLTPAAAMLKKAKSKGMLTMVGCMVESSVGISAAAHLAPLLDFADLDGAVLLSKDIANGVSIDDGKINLAQEFGNGITLI